MRLYELAREMNIPSDEMLKRCIQQLGIKLANRLSGLSDEEVVKIREAYGAKPAAPAAPLRLTQAAPSAPAAEKAPVAAPKPSAAPAKSATPSAKAPAAAPKTPSPAPKAPHAPRRTTAAAKAAASKAAPEAAPVAEPAPAPASKAAPTAAPAATAPTAAPRAPAAPAVPGRPLIPSAPAGARPKAAPEEDGAARGRRRRKGGRTSGEDEAVAEIVAPKFGRYVPPATIPRYPRRGMRHQRPKSTTFRRPSPVVVEKPSVYELVAPMSVKEMSATLGVKANNIILKLMQSGAMLTVNAVLNAEQMESVAKELGIPVHIRAAVSAETAVEAIEQKQERPEDLKPRPPVVTFLGHVDHGKTSLLDRIRKTDVAAHEYGGITQHIGANRVTIKGKTVVFLDTPGHEAFTAMRARGANVTDIAVLVVAADDGVMPQTEEAIDHARAANVPIVVAINKCDKPEANPTRVRQELAKLGLQAEEWGGDTVCVDVSAVTGKGVDELLEMLTLVAELKELKANPDKPARGTVLDARMEVNRGPSATVLIQDGTLKVGDVVVAGSAFGRVKALYDDRGKPLQMAGPSWPVAVVGLNSLPDASDRIFVVDDIQKARAIAEERQYKAREAAAVKREHVSLENLFTSIAAGQVKELRIIVRADVRGTIEALNKILSEIQSTEVKLHVLRASVGGISVSDVLLADASDAIIVGMNVTPDTAARALAEQKGVAIHTYNVIYRVKEEIERALAGMLTPEEREVIGGHAEVRKTFHISRVGTIAGCYVRDGTVARNHHARLVRDGTVVFQGRIGSLKREKDDIRDAREGFECGIHLDGFDDVKIGDVIETYQVEKIQRTLGSSSAGA